VARGSDDKHAAIVAAATTLFARYGYRRTSIDEIARAADIAKGTLYLYFDSKEACFRGVCSAVMKKVLDDLSVAAEADGPLATRLEGALAAKFALMFELVDRSPHARELLESTNAVSGDILIAADRTYEQRLAELLKAADRKREIGLRDAGLSSAAAAAWLVRSGRGLSVPDADGTMPTEPVFRARLRELVRLFLRAVVPGAKKPRR
jgi:AcrR family transcriptional regulator